MIPTAQLPTEKETASLKSELAQQTGSIKGELGQETGSIRRTWIERPLLSK